MRALNTIISVNDTTIMIPESTNISMSALNFPNNSSCRSPGRSQ